MMLSFHRIISLTVLLPLATVSCSTARIDQSLPTVHPPHGAPLSIQVDPGPFPGESLIIEGLFPEVGSEATPLERFEEVIETALEESMCFELIEQGPGQSRSDAAYRLEFTITRMESEETKLGFFMSLLDQEKLEYVVVAISYQLFNNYDDSEIGKTKQVVDHYLLNHQNYRLQDHLGMKAYFDKLERDKRPWAEATMRSVVRLVADVKNRVDSHRRSSGAGDDDRG